MTKFLSEMLSQTSELLSIFFSKRLSNNFKNHVNYFAESKFFPKSVSVPSVHRKLVGMVLLKPSADGIFRIGGAPASEPAAQKVVEIPVESAIITPQPLQSQPEVTKSMEVFTLDEEDWIHRLGVTQPPPAPSPPRYTPSPIDGGPFHRGFTSWGFNLVCNALHYLSNSTIGVTLGNFWVKSNQIKSKAQMLCEMVT